MDRTRRRGVTCTKWDVYGFGCVRREAGELYIVLERRTRRKRRTSVLCASRVEVVPIAEVDPTPFSLREYVSGVEC